MQTHWKKPQNDVTLQNFIDKHIIDVENVQRDLKKKRKWKIYKTSSYFNLNVEIYPCQKLTACSNGCILSYQKLTACNKLNVEMGGVFWRGGSWEVAKPMTITQLKMEDACNLYNVIENVLPKRSN